MLPGVQDSSGCVTAWTWCHCGHYRFCPLECFDLSCIGEWYFSCRSTSLGLVPSACLVPALRLGLQEVPALVSSITDSRMLPCAVPPTPSQPVSKQLFPSCLLLCYIVPGCSSTCSLSVLLDLPMGISLLCFCSALSSCLVFFCNPFSPVVGPLVLIFCDWGFDTYKVTLHRCLVVDSFSWCFFCSLGYPRDTLEKTDLCVEVMGFSPLLSAGEKLCILLWSVLHLPYPWRIPICHMAMVWMQLSSSRKVSVRQELYLILMCFQECWLM